ncbi:MAG: hypothetical protein AB1521_13560 [Bacteroidota bacterium]
MISSEEKGRQASINGFAHEHIVCGILMKKYQNVSLVDLPLSPYDIIIVIKNEKNEEEIIRAQVKTARTSVSFTGGTRGGVDREYKSDVKTYVQSTKTSDVVIGYKPISEDQFELYFIPTILIEKWDSKSKSLNILAPLKNNYDILNNCKNRRYILEKAKEYSLL